METESNHEAAREKMATDTDQRCGAAVETIDLYQRTANSLRRMLESIGLQRRARMVPTLAEHIAKLAREHADDVVVDDEAAAADENASAA